MNKMLDNIKKEIRNKTIIIFGELHGTKEIPEMLSRFFSEVAKEEDFNLCLEFPQEFQDQISSYINNGDYNILKNISFFSKKNCSDGRNSLEYINLIKNVHEINLKYNRNIKIFCVDPSAKNQEEKEKGLAENITKKVSDKKTFVILGSVHASKKEVNFGDITIIPAGLLIFNKLKEKMLNVRIYQKNEKLSKEEELFNEGFDHILEIKRVTPCSFLS